MVGQPVGAGVRAGTGVPGVRMAEQNAWSYRYPSPIRPTQLYSAAAGCRCRNASVKPCSALRARHQRLALVPVSRGPEIARGRLSIRGNPACRHRPRLPNMRYLIRSGPSPKIITCKRARPAAGGGQRTIRLRRQPDTGWTADAISAWSPECDQSIALRHCCGVGAMTHWHCAAVTCLPSLVPLSGVAF